MKRLAVVTTHPIQYNAPFFKKLSESGKIKLKVFYTWSQSSGGIKYDPGFKKEIAWDIPLLEGYDYTFVENISAEAGTHHFKGIINPTLNKEISEWNPGIILVFGWSFHSHLRCLRFFYKKIPVLFRGDSTLLDANSFSKKWIRKFWLKWIYKHVDFALYVGSENKKYFKEYGLKDDQLIFVPHAIDNDRFNDADNCFSGSAAKWRKEIGLQEDDLVVQFVGKFEKKKNPFFLLALAEKLAVEKIKFLFVGNGELEKELKQKALSVPNIYFIDFQNQQNMPVVYRLGDIFILPSSGPGETWGLAVNEAMACSKPVMVSKKAGCANDLVKENSNGIIFDVGDENKCINFINKSFSDRKMMTDMGIESKKIIQQFSFSQMQKNFFAFLESIKII